MIQVKNKQVGIPDNTG